LDLSTVHKSLSEADFFLGKMREQEERFFGNKEPFDYYLSAFLSVGRSVDYRLRHEQGAIYKPWRAAWDGDLAPAENALIKALVDDRNTEVHGSGSGRSVGKEGVEFGIGEHRLPGGGGMMTIGGPPGMPPAVLCRPAYSFKIDGVDRKATEACATYLGLLRRMVAEFAAAHP
jgi:hypothetical protein